MQAPTSPSAPHSAPPASSTLTLTGRLKRLAVYFGDQRLAWSLAIIATLVGALTEPLLPALLKPLLDQGFTEGTLPLWIIPIALLGLFAIRGLAQFVGQYALARIANEGMLRLRRKVEASSRAPTLLKTKRGAGYFLDADVQVLR